MNELIPHIDKIHTTPMGMGRIARNLNIPESHVMDTCRDIVRHGTQTRRGKNIYVTYAGMCP